MASYLQELELTLWVAASLQVVLQVCSDVAQWLETESVGDDEADSKLPD